MKDLMRLVVLGLIVIGQHADAVSGDVDSKGEKSSESKKYSYDVRELSVPVDHFNFVNEATFNLRYLYSEAFVEKNSPEKPIFFYTGNEGDIEWFAKNTGFVWELAKKFNAYVVFAEHRYYGKSMPFGKDSFNTTNGNLGFFTVEQTLEDYAQLITNLLGSRSLPVIAFGGSYGGMLAAWFRMKYPHLVTGALAASAPIWQFTDITPCDIFAKITTSVFRNALNSNCSVNIGHSWKLFEKLAASEDGKKLLTDTLKLCDPIKSADDLSQFMTYLEDIYGNLAMANYPYNSSFLAPLPAYPVRQVCFYLKELHTNDTNFLLALHNALSVYTGNAKCLNWKAEGSSDNADSAGWNIQSCNQMVMPMCSSSRDTMFRDNAWDFKKYSDSCFKKYHLRPNAYDIILRYGGRNIETATNIIFSNGLLDPWSGGGVLQAPNDRIQIIIMPEGAHHLDLRASEDADPASVHDARLKERDTIEQWILQYYT